MTLDQGTGGAKIFFRYSLQYRYRGDFMNTFNANLKILVFLLFMAFIFNGPIAFANANSSDINYQIYYRSITDDILEDMKNFDLVILEALQLEEGMAESLKASNTQVYGYVSALEVGTWDDALNGLVSEKDLLTIDGKVMMHGKNPIGDLRKPSFRSAIISIIGQRIVENNLDGIFIDSTSVMNDFFDDESIGPDLLTGYKSLLEEVKTTYPELDILQNRGFAYLNTVSGFLDGVVWENFDSPRANHIKRYQRRIDLLESLPEHIDVYTISYKNFDVNKNHATDLGWVHLNHTVGTSHNVWIPFSGR